MLTSIAFSSSTARIESFLKPLSSFCVITELVVTKMHALQNDGSSWDMTSGPDVFFKIFNQNDVIFESGVSNDLDVSNLPISFKSKFPLTLPYLNNQYKVVFYDYEQGSLFKDDTYIDSYQFNPKDFERKSKIEFSKENSNLKFAIFVEWEN